jgi:hypothetical protein
VRRSEPRRVSVSRPRPPTSSRKPVSTSSETWTPVSASGLLLETGVWLMTAASTPEDVDTPTPALFCVTMVELLDGLAVGEADAVELDDALEDAVDDPGAVDDDSEVAGEDVGAAEVEAVEESEAVGAAVVAVDVADVVVPAGVSDDVVAGAPEDTTVDAYGSYGEDGAALAGVIAAHRKTVVKTAKAIRTMATSRARIALRTALPSAENLSFSFIAQPPDNQWYAPVHNIERFAQDVSRATNYASPETTKSPRTCRSGHVPHMFTYCH